MALDEELEDEFCANCGERHYNPSRVPGLCKDCQEELRSLRAPLVPSDAA